MMTVLNRLEDVVGLGLTGVVCDVPFSSSLDGWRIDGGAVSGYPVIRDGAVDVQFNQMDAVFTHDPYQITGNRDYILHVEAKMQQMSVNRYIRFKLVFSDGTEIQSSITGINEEDFTAWDYRFHVDAGITTVQLSFYDNMAFFMRNLSIKLNE